MWRGKASGWQVGGCDRCGDRVYVLLGGAAKGGGSDACTRCAERVEVRRGRCAGANTWRSQRNALQATGLPASDFPRVH